MGASCWKSSATCGQNRAGTALPCPNHSPIWLCARCTRAKLALAALDGNAARVLNASPKSSAQVHKTIYAGQAYLPSHGRLNMVERASAARQLQKHAQGRALLTKRLLPQQPTPT